MPKLTEIGAYETKTHLAAFLRKVQAGQRFTITQRGRPIAELVPYGYSRQGAKPGAAERMKTFMREQPSVKDAEVRSLIEEGRD